MDMLLDSGEYLFKEREVFFKFIGAICAPIFLSTVLLAEEIVLSINQNNLKQYAVLALPYNGNVLAADVGKNIPTALLDFSSRNLRAVEVDCAPADARLNVKINDRRAYVQARRCTIFSTSKVEAVSSVRRAGTYQIVRVHKVMPKIGRQMIRRGLLLLS